MAKAAQSKYTFEQFVAEVRTINPKFLMSESMWISNGRITANEYCLLVYEKPLKRVAEHLREKEEAKHAEDPYYEPKSKGEPSSRKRLLKHETRVQLTRVGQLSGGLEIPFIQTWEKLPKKITSIKEMSEIFFQAEPDKRLATAQNMIRRAIKRGDAVILE